MAGYVIHLAVGEEVFKKNKTLLANVDYKEFINGIVMPDYEKDLMHNKGIYSEEVREQTHKMDMNKSYDNLTSYELGYFVHLLTDEYFYKKYEFCSEFYNDYDRINSDVISKYNVKLPDIVKGFVKIKSGTPKILKLEDICCFIDNFAKLNLKNEFERLKNTKMNKFFLNIDKGL